MLPLFQTRAQLAEIGKQSRCSGTACPFRNTSLQIFAPVLAKSNAGPAIEESGYMTEIGAR